MAKTKTALFGGTFDPIHLGHTTVAAEALGRIGAEKIVFTPARLSPLKQNFPQVRDNDRLKMISLAIAENKSFDLSSFELEKSEPSYTLETVRHFQEEYGSDTELYWLIGADTVSELPRWYGIEELIDCCNLSVMYRAGFSVPDFSDFTCVFGQSRVEKLQRNIIPTSLIDISSTEIRKRLAADEDVSNMLVPFVAEYIRKHHLYEPK